MTWKGGAVAPGVHCVLAPNPSAWTLEGTNTWVIGHSESSGSRTVVVDPGPDHLEHLEAVAGQARSSIAAIILTHRHIDHAEGAPRLSELTGVPVISSREINGLDLGDVELRMHRTPGHSSDSICVTVRTEMGNYLLTGDTVLGRGTTLVAHPDGRLDEYFESLRLLRDHCVSEEVDILLPGHGPISTTPVELIDFYEQHRRERLRQVRQATANGLTTVDQIRAQVYPDIDESVTMAANLTIAAQLEYLKDH